MTRPDQVHLDRLSILLRATIPHADVLWCKDGFFVELTESAEGIDIESVCELIRSCGGSEIRLSFDVDYRLLITWQCDKSEKRNSMGMRRSVELAIGDNLPDVRLVDHAAEATAATPKRVPTVGDRVRVTALAWPDEDDSNARAPLGFEGVLADIDTDLDNDDCARFAFDDPDDSRCYLWAADVEVIK